MPPDSSAILSLRRGRMTSTRTPTQVRSRRVFYIPGYDPFHARRYRELYRREGAAQAQLSGYALSVRAREGAPHAWTVRAEIEGAEVETEVEVLTWSDIVRASMAQGIAATYLQMLAAIRVYFGTGAVFRLARLRMGPIIAGFYPVGMLILQAILAVAAGWATFALCSLLLPVWLAGAAAGAAGVAVLWGFRRIDGRLFVHYLMHDLAFTARDRGAYPAELEARLADFRQRLRAALESTADEVLVVGHSTGAQLAVSLVADALRDGVPARPALSLLTLGQSIPMASFLPRADRLRGDLRLVAAAEAITWVDVTAPGDGCAFALCDPVAVTGVAPEGKRWPLVLSCAFSRTLRPQTWMRLRRRYYRLHFQYLCAFDALSGKPDDYDYFRITAGPLTLGARLAARSPSKSRIERPTSGYTSQAA
jgi:hypothetical protein